MVVKRFFQLLLGDHKSVIGGTAGRVLDLHTTNTGSIPATQYSPLVVQVLSLSTELGQSPEHGQVWPQSKKVSSKGQRENTIT